MNHTWVRSVLTRNDSIGWRSPELTSVGPGALLLPTVAQARSVPSRSGWFGRSGTVKSSLVGNLNERYDRPANEVDLDLSWLQRSLTLVLAQFTWNRVCLWGIVGGEIAVVVAMVMRMVRESDDNVVLICLGLAFLVLTLLRRWVVARGSSEEPP